MSGLLYLIGTPIGNPEDITLRGMKALSSADFVAGEHKEPTDALLKSLGDQKPVITCFGRVREYTAGLILRRLAQGETGALVTDAGMPAVADPGEAIVKACLKAEIKVVCVPGPCAALAALAVSGLDTGRFTFEGFLSKAAKSRRARLEELKSERRTMIFYEVQRKLKGTLSDMLSAWGDREVSIQKDLTKPVRRAFIRHWPGQLRSLSAARPRESTRWSSGVQREDTSKQ
jgi:16S rRNA (cytidine1402-2'-O)-methyltransferase